MASPKVLCSRFGTFAICLLLASFPFPMAGHAQSTQARVPVLIELFTSEGCSDCPPADRLLEELDTRQPIAHAQAIVLSEHVTYWNHLGWREPFSLDEIDQRQNEYGGRFHLDSVYTPQAVIDGAAQLVGNNGSGLAQAVDHAASTPKKPLTIGDAHWENGSISFTVHGPADSGSRLVAVLASDATGPKVIRGENAGRTLHHVAVVRSIKEFNFNNADGRALRLSAGSLAHDQGAAPTRLVVFIADKKTGHVTAVNEQTLNR
jgi:hypothetical protein